MLRIEKNTANKYQGKWCFSYHSDYVLDIQTGADDGGSIISLYDTMEQVELNLTLIKYSEFYIEIFVEDDDENFLLKLYPISPKGSIGVEIRYSEEFAKSKLPQNNCCAFSQFVSIGDVFPDWLNGIWKGKLSFICFAIEKNKANTLKIAAMHEITGNIEIINNGYIGHSGILLTLYNSEWIDKTIVCELQLDYANNHVRYIENMLLPVYRCENYDNE